MSKHQQLYRQCRMEKKTETGKLVHTAWIPTQFAHVGKNISIKNSDDEWVGGWQVVEASSGTRTHDDMETQRDAHKRWEEVLA